MVKYLKRHADSQHGTGNTDFLNLQEHEFNLKSRVKMLEWSTEGQLPIFYKFLLYASKELGLIPASACTRNKRCRKP